MQMEQRWLEHLHTELDNLAAQLDRRTQPAFDPVVAEMIVTIVKRLQRDYGRGVLPRMVQPWLEFYRAEGTLRRDMMTLASAGKLRRVGGKKSRQGYIVR